MIMYTGPPLTDFVGTNVACKLISSLVSRTRSWSVGSKQVACTYHVQPDLVKLKQYFSAANYSLCNQVQSGPPVSAEANKWLQRTQSLVSQRSANKQATYITKSEMSSSCSDPHIYYLIPMLTCIGAHGAALAAQYKLPAAVSSNCWCTAWMYVCLRSVLVVSNWRSTEGQQSSGHRRMNHLE